MSLVCCLGRNANGELGSPHAASARPAVAPAVASAAAAAATSDAASSAAIAWAKGLLADKEERRKLGDAEFKRQDADGNGTLDKMEAFSCLERMCVRFDLQLPRAEKCHELFVRCDKSGDGVIQLVEFRNYFRVVLEGCVRKAEAEQHQQLEATVQGSEPAEPTEGAAANVHFVALPTAPRAIGAGFFHSFAVTVTGELYVWGAGSGGQLGRPRLAEHPFGEVAASVIGEAAPAVLAGELAAGAAGGRNHTLAVTTSGRAYSWGRAAAGQLGHGVGTAVGGTRRIADADVSEPKHVEAVGGAPPLPRFACVRAGEHFSAAIAAESGQLYTWGCDANGRLGRSAAYASEPRPLAASVFSRQAVVTLALGWRHALASTQSGVCYAWGAGGSGQLGRGSERDCATPAPVEALARERVEAVAAGRAHSLATTQARSHLPLVSPDLH